MKSLGECSAPTSSVVPVGGSRSMRYLDSVLGDQPRLEQWLRSQFDSAESIAIRTGFLTSPAVEQVRKSMTGFLDRGGSLLIVAGGAPDQADPDALIALGALLQPYPHAALRVVVQPDEFQNAKTYHASFADGHAEALIGSPNLTMGGMRSNHEASVVLDSRDPAESEIVAAVLRGIEAFRDRPGSTAVSEETRLLLSGRASTSLRRRRSKPGRTMLPTHRLDDILQDTMEEIDTTASGYSVGVPTGFTELDELTGGLSSGSLTVIASRPGVGSSTLLLDFARCAAIKHQLRTAVFCLDRPVTDVISQMLCAESKIKRWDLRTGRMSDEDWSRLAHRMAEISDAPLLVNSTPGPTLDEFCEHVNELDRAEQLYLIAIDPINLIDANLGLDASRERELSVITRRLKLLALELNIPIVVTAELGRGVEARTDKRPLVTDLRDSDTLSQVADNILLIHRPDAYDRDDSRGGEADLILAKHRLGPTAITTVAHQLHLGRFIDMVGPVRPTNALPLSQTERPVQISNAARPRHPIGPRPHGAPSRTKASARFRSAGG
ncbi:DnaB-like helicase C-terminal domain-containing protein [Nocardia arizonensis]|uniref:DnaB-like helicase C-terminal domain-containing protein n=2 Tax=Nocardia TaxID=1817 RepID=UPI00138F1AA5|nr:DnaB-like helicase C-terminal domain-containing protein [Nocardia arizonensis]